MNMENGTSYLSSPPLPPPPSAHPSSTPSNVTSFQEALMSRMGRPFGLSSTDIKEIHNNTLMGLSAAASPRPEGFNFPLLSQMGQPPFLHPVFDPRHPFNSVAAGAFRPIFASPVSSSSSAFNPPPCSSSVLSTTNSTLKGPIHNNNNNLGCRNSPPILFSPGQNLFPRTSMGSPGSPPSSSPPNSLGSLGRIFKTDENSNTAPMLERHESVSPISMDSANDDERTAKKPRISSVGLEGAVGCPICGMPLRSSDLESHYTQELDYLSKLSAALYLNQQQALKIARNQSAQNVPNKLSSGIEVAPRSRWDTFQRIQRNRQSRIRVKLSRRAGKRPDEILEEEFLSSSRKSILPGEEDIDIVGDESGAGGCSSSSSNGGGAAGKGNTSLCSSSEGSHIYGPSQFTEADVLNCMNEENNSEVIPSSSSSSNTHLNSVNSSDVKRETTSNGSPNPGMDESSCSSPTSTENIDALKEKLKALEDHTKCAKCSNTLKNPVVSIGCWHIQCQRCWLISLGTNKSCSQCSVTSVPQDLRRVFL
ncbi:E3 ubiquitin-protein ligase RNF220 [Lepeophtheirus salmonis]|uniref:E3 ubiquitin-protein ligase RNF220 n=1 Tax=Lepeophtheirus salmonis TaxID=72036 RepID=UPI003AF3463A